MYIADPTKQPSLLTTKLPELTFSPANGVGKHIETKTINLESRVEAEALLNRKLKRKLETGEAGQATVNEKVNPSGTSLAS